MNMAIRDLRRRDRRTVARGRDAQDLLSFWSAISATTRTSEGL
jgi:hypothetical protein